MKKFDGGSFRDPEGHVFIFENQIYRTLVPHAVERMQVLLAQPFFQEWVQEGKLIETKLLKKEEDVLWHQKIDIITYPFEWSFSMVKDAALLTLDLMKTLLKNGFILKDGSAWNICFQNGVPCFYDILSIDTYQEGQPWEGFSQFLREFLYPLMLQSYQGIDFQPLWRATLEGVPSSFIRKNFFKKGVFKYVYLTEKLSHHTFSIRNEFSSDTFPQTALCHIIDDLKSCIDSLKINDKKSFWKNYAQDNSYSADEIKAKEAFVQEGLQNLAPRSIVDLGCNTGQYSALASQKMQVISCDLDASCIDILYRQKHPHILPVVLHLMNPTPAMGWDLQERKSIFERLSCVDAFMALAILHHICIAENVPLSHFIVFLKKIAPQGMIEWVDKSDPMVQVLLQNRKDIFLDYTFENFRASVSQHFEIQKIVPLGTRKLFLVTKK